MLEIKDKKNPGKRYQGKKGKLIHLEPKLFEFLTSVAEAKGYNLKTYIEALCEAQARGEAQKIIELQKKREID